VNTYDAIGVERLRVANMSRRPKPKPGSGQPDAYLPNGATAKAKLNRSILDAGWAQFTSILAGKAEEAGRRVIMVNPVGTSIGCHRCGARCAQPRQDTRAGLGSGQAARAA
jgi:putative transposase